MRSWHIGRVLALYAVGPVERTQAAFILYRITFDPIQKSSFASRLHYTGTVSEQCRYKTVLLS